MSADRPLGSAAPLTEAMAADPATGAAEVLAVLRPDTSALLG